MHKLITKIIVGICLNGVALYAICEFLDKIKYTGGVKFFIIGGLIMGFLNIFLKPLMKFLSLPFIILTLGLLLIVINAALLFLLEKIIAFLHYPDVTFQITGFITYLIAGLVFGVINWVEHFILKFK